jgi:adenine-specific DNA-methyltransferase
MKLHKTKPSKSLNKAYYKQSLSREQIELFKKELKNTFNHIDEKQDEEYHKNIIGDLFKNVYCKDKYLVNVNKKEDLVIRLGNSTSDDVGVLLEFKKPTEKRDMVSAENANVKALQELVLYYLRQTVDNENHKITNLVVTNIYEWFIFDGVWFEKNIFRNSKLKKDYLDFKNSGHDTKYFYDKIAAKHLADFKEEVPCTYFNLLDYKKNIEDENQKNDDELIDLYKILSPEHLLNKKFVNDSNSLNTDFYNELLYIIGLEESKETAKKTIRRINEAERNEGSLIENTITKLKSKKYFGYDSNEETENQYYELALELCITWLNRILFLKLLESQLIKYHRGDKENYAFLTAEKITDFDELEELFFEVLAEKTADRNPSIAAKYKDIPYLNSSLFEMTDLEKNALALSNLKDRLEFPVFKKSVLKKGTKDTIKPKTSLKYLLEFLDAYNFASESNAKIQEENKSIINASVLGLIFEKINGYKDGSFFTPGFITMYMCRETIRKAVVEKFKTHFPKCGNITDFEELKDKIDYTNKSQREEANQLINEIKIVDPAVGSGHFLVSALNEMIAIKADLNILSYTNGNRILGYTITLDNDELIIQNQETDKLFEYTLNQNNKIIPELQELQDCLFTEKQTIIENCLFGVDINPKSVMICQLRLWIELLKNAYYTKASDYKELHTLPNIDINIKTGNSLISKFAIKDNVFERITGFQKKLTDYKKWVSIYKETNDKKAKAVLKQNLQLFKDEFKLADLRVTKLQNDLRKLNGEFYDKYQTYQVFASELTEKEIKAKEKLEKEINDKQVEIQTLKDNPIYAHAFEWRFEFPEILDDKGNFIGFDVVIGNPPYIGEKGNKEIFRDIKSANLSSYYQRKMDIFYFFFHLGILLLKSKGKISFITTNYFLTSDGGDFLRTDFKDETTIDSLVNLNSLKVFESAKGQHNILTFISKGKDLNYLSKNLITNEIGDCDENLFKSIVNGFNLNTKFYSVPQSELYENNGNYIRLQGIGNKESSNDNNSIFNKILSKSKPLLQICDVSQGILSGVDRISKKHLENHLTDNENLNCGVYVLTNEEYLKKEFTTEENSLIKPWFKNSDIGKYFTSESSKYKVIYATRDIDIEDYPKIKSHLYKYEGVIKNRSQERGEMQAAVKLGKWWVIFAARTKSVFEGEKIVCPQRTKSNIFGYNNDIWYSSADVYYITNAKDGFSLKYILALLNSKLYYFWLYNKGKRKGESLELYYTPLSEIPIKKAKNQQDFVTLVDQILTLKKANPSADTSTLETEIDDLVYKLYELTDEEIKVVKNS